MKQSKLLAIYLIFLIWFITFPCLALAISAVNLSLEHWAYRVLDILEGYGLIDSALSSTRPYSRLEAARLVWEAEKRWAGISLKEDFIENNLISSSLSRLKLEFKPELIDLRALEGTPISTYLKPVDELILKYEYQSDSPITLPQRGMPAIHTIYPFYNQDGLVYRKGNNFVAELYGEGRLWNHVSFYYRPLFSSRQGENAHLELEKSYLKFELFNIELEVGRDSLWWGPGRNGALLLSNNARPFDMLKFSNQRPFSIPFLGLLKFNLFLSPLDYGEPFVAEPLLHGLRLHFKPHPIFEIGISHIAIFEGQGRKALSFKDYLDIIFGNANREYTKLDSNQQIAIDLSLRWPNFYKILPLARSLKFYGEYGAEDTGFLPDRRALLLGLAFYDIFLLGRIDLFLEYTDTSPASVPAAWYTHNFYPPIFHDRIFGHHAGSNTDDFFVRLHAFVSPKINFGVDFEYEFKGKWFPEKTYTYRCGIDLEYLFQNNVWLKGRYVGQKFIDPAGIAGGDKTNHLIGLEIHSKF
ncbi:MAG: capsule assembly Wzi family protein [Thermodesulfobacteriota bacterium]